MSASQAPQSAWMPIKKSDLGAVQEYIGVSLQHSIPR